jgi:hypothetical protein
MHVVVACIGSKNPWEAKNFTGSQGTHPVLWETKDSLPCSKGHTSHMRHTRQMNPFHTLPFKIHFDILSLSAHRYSKSSLSYRFPWRKLFMTFFFWVFYIHPTHLILTVICEEWKLWSSPFWNFCRLLLLSSSFSLN